MYASKTRLKAGTVLSKLLIDKGMSYRDLSNATGIATQMISNLCTSKKEFSLNDSVDIGFALNLPLNYFIQAQADFNNDSK